MSDDALAVIVVALLLAVLVRIYWRLVVNLLLVGTVALVFAGIFTVTSMMRPPSS
jgi:hypothetical protein